MNEKTKNDNLSKQKAKKKKITYHYQKKLKCYTFVRNN